MIRERNLIPIFVVGLAAYGCGADGDTTGEQMGAGGAGGTMMGGAPGSIAGSGGGTSPTLTFYTADVHAHVDCQKNGTPIAGAQILQFMKNEGINIAAVLIWGGNSPPGTPYGSVGPDWINFNGQNDDPLSEPSTIIHWDVEISAVPGSFSGHQTLLNLSDKGVVANGMVGYPGQTYALPNYKYVHDQGGIIGFAHGEKWTPGSYVFQDGLGPLELPVDIALDHPDFYGGTGYDSAYRWLWYQMLDAGFNIPPAGGSDNACSMNRAGVGRIHTVFGLPPGTPLSYPNFIDAIRKGRTMIRLNTAADKLDILDLNVDGTSMGGNLIVPAGPRTVQVEVKASSGTAGKMLELVVNGTVAQTAMLTTTTQSYRFPVTLTKSGWIAARTSGAHSAATFVLLGGCPVRNDPVAARKWETYPDAYYEALLLRFGRTAAEVRARVDESKVAWERIAMEGEGVAQPKCVPVP